VRAQRATSPEEITKLAEHVHSLRLSYESGFAVVREKSDVLPNAQPRPPRRLKV